MKKIVLILVLGFMFVACEEKKEPCLASKAISQTFAAMLNKNFDCNVDMVYKDLLEITDVVCMEKNKSLASNICQVFASQVVSILSTGTEIKYGCNPEKVKAIIPDPSKLCNYL